MKEISVKLGVVFLITVIFLSINVGVKKDETIKGTETKEKKEEKEEKARTPHQSDDQSCGGHRNIDRIHRRIDKGAQVRTGERNLPSSKLSYHIRLKM